MHLNTILSRIFVPALISAAAFYLAGCSSSGSSTAAVPSHAPSGAVYGSGPDSTAPYPQDEGVTLNGVPGAKISYAGTSRSGNKDYRVLGHNYKIWNNCDSYQEIGMASWYGPGFHGNRTSSGEVYNQKGFTAAHRNLPLPSYLKVTNLENGKAVIVRVNDRGPFHANRIIDLSEGAARAINMTGKGTARVKLEYIKVLPDNRIANLRSGSHNGAAALLADNSQTAAPAAAAPAAKPAGKRAAGLTSSRDEEAAYAPPALAARSPAPAPTAESAGSYVQVFTSRSQSGADTHVHNIRNRVSYPVRIVAENGLFRVRVGPIPENSLNNTLYQIRGMGYTDSFIKRI